MTIVKVDCTGCGASNSVSANALLAVAGIADLDTDFGGELCWICTACQEWVSALVAWPLFLQLIRAGVTLIEDEVDADLPPHPEQPRASAAFIPNDLLELHELLATDHWFDALASASA